MHVSIDYATYRSYYYRYPQETIQPNDSLGRYTRTPQRCWFARWEGFGDLLYLGSLRRRGWRSRTGT